MKCSAFDENVVDRKWLTVKTTMQSRRNVTTAVAFLFPKHIMLKRFENIFSYNQ